MGTSSILVQLTLKMVRVLLFAAHGLDSRDNDVHSMFINTLLLESSLGKITFKDMSN